MRDALEIRVLGELCVLRDGAPIALPASKKTRALLGYLAVTARPQRRDRLCSLLWDGPDDPRAALRWSLTKLRPLVDDGDAIRLVTDREHVALEARGATIDLASIRDAVPGGAPGSAARAGTDALLAVAPLFRGDLLEGLDLPDCFRWDEWCRGERESLRRLGVAILGELAGRLRATAPDEALIHARARVALDPLDEAAHAAVIDLLVALERRPEALAQYASCARLLERELSRQPSRELERLRIAIAAGAPSSAPPPETPAPATRVEPAAPTRPRSPLVGRVAEAATLREIVATCGEVLVMLGDPGIGKTRLLEELADLARAAGSIVVQGRGIEAEMVRPYGAWLDALGAASGGDADPFALVAGADGDRNRLFESVAAWLVARAGAATVTVILDDLQWIDDGSAALFHFVARSPACAGKVRLACAARPGELADNPAAVRLFRGLARAPNVRQIGLSPLTDADTAALAAAHAPGIDARRVVAESGGHPLFAVEIARALARGETSWSSLDGLLGERLALLDGAAREVVPWAAALGRAFTPELLAGIAGISLAELARAVDELERRAIVRPVGAAWDFAHDLVRTAAYHRVSEPRRRLLHLQIARVLAETTDDEVAGEVAHHAALGGDSALCAQASVAAGERALRLFAYEEAAELADRAAPHASRLVGIDRARLQMSLLSIAGHADRRGVRRAAIVAELERAIVDAQAAGFHTEAARGAGALGRLHYEAGELSSALTGTIDSVERSRSGDLAGQAWSLAHAAQCFVMIGRDMARAAALANEAADLATQTGIELPELAFALALVRHHQGDDDAAISLLHRAAELFGARGDHHHHGAARCRAAMIEVMRRRPHAALVHSEAARAIAERMDEGGERALSVVVEAVARFSLAPDDAAAGAIEETLLALRAADARALLACGLNCAGEVELAEGWIDAAARHGDEALVVATRAGRDNEIVLAHALLARVARLRGDTAQARRHVDELRAARTDELAARARAAIELQR